MKKISELSFITTGSLDQIYLCGVIKYFQISCKMTILQPVVLPSLGDDRAESNQSCSAWNKSVSCVTSELHLVLSMSECCSICNFGTHREKQT
jgi:hypothetical protein